MLSSMGRPLRTVHVVGISVGAFAADTCTVALKDGLRAGSTSKGAPERGEVPYVRLTLLDPFTWRGVLGFGYGRKHFGRAADFAVQLLNTDDKVPSTNRPLPRCFTYDVTKAKKAFHLPPQYDGHNWPADLFGRRFSNRAKRWPLLSDPEKPVHTPDRPRRGVRTVDSKGTRFC